MTFEANRRIKSCLQITRTYVSRHSPSKQLEAFGGWHKDSLKEMKRFAEACVPVRSELEDVEKAKNRIFQEFSVKFQQIAAEMIIARM